MSALLPVVARLPARNDELAAPPAQQATLPDGIDRDDSHIRSLPIASLALALALLAARAGRTGRGERADAKDGR